MNTPQEEARYNKQFHHSLFTWHITIQGFVFVGLLSAPANTTTAVGWICLSLALASFIYTGMMICLFSDRIYILEGYGANPPANWQEEHKDKSKIKPHGEGTWFFIVVSLFFVLANVALLLVKKFL